MGLFDKKYCDICGEKIGLLGNRKLEDGNLCKACAAKLSPWFSDRRGSSVAEIKEQLAYREDNKAAVAALHVTRSLGDDMKVLMDEDARKFVVTRSRQWREDNPDVMDYAQVTGCNLDIDENRRELMREDKDGKRISYNPPRYEYEYDFYMEIQVNHPYFDQIRFRLNNDHVLIQPAISRGFILTGGSPNLDACPEYMQYKQMGEEIRAALMQARQELRDEVAAAAAPKVAMTCPWCGATTTPDASGKCEYCGGALNG